MKKRKTLVVPALISALILPSAIALAADQTMTQEELQTQEQIYGSQLMTEQERSEYRAQMRAAKTPEEQEQIRMAHHKRMEERAKEHGVTIPGEPPVRGGGMNSSSTKGSGGGMGHGGGNR